MKKKPMRDVNDKNLIFLLFYDIIDINVQNSNTLYVKALRSYEKKKLSNISHTKSFFDFLTTWWTLDKSYTTRGGLSPRVP